MLRETILFINMVRIMNLFTYLRFLICIQCIVFISGCKIIEWGQANFKQSDRYEMQLVKRVKPYLKSTFVYDSLATIADFDAMLLTDDVRMTYVDYYGKKHLMSEEKESVMRQRLLNENKYYISFYVLGSQAENLYPTHKSLFTGEFYKMQSLLGDKDAEWQVRLKVQDKLYAPDSIRVIDMPTEYQHFFGNRFSQFKSVYLVKFDAMDAYDHEILPAGHHDVQLIFTSARYEAKLEWKDVAYTQKHSE